MVTLREFLLRQERIFLERAISNQRSTWDYLPRRLGLSPATFYRKLAKHGLGQVTIYGPRTQEQRRIIRLRDAPPGKRIGCWALSRTIKVDVYNRCSTIGLLRLFGYTGKLSARQFWGQPPMQLEWFRQDFRQHYLRLARQMHPDNGGTHEQAVTLNNAWQILDARFKKHCQLG